jgi:hypothetical protein
LIIAESPIVRYRTKLNGMLAVSAGYSYGETDRYKTIAGCKVKSRDEI